MDEPLKDFEFSIKKAGFKKAVMRETGLEFKVFEHEPNEMVPITTLVNMLRQCYDVGYDRIEVGQIVFSSGHTCGMFEAKGFPRDLKGPDGWPAIWRIVEKLGVRGGPGNPGQMQITKGSGEEMQGQYEFKRKEE